ncbi:hypothetical protein [Pseudomonas atacamensis]|uniref:hypothetical protein n=1 Tax=Pseudomonas atacamensis TaxID=2565368 RepID=UPI003857420F
MVTPTISFQRPLWLAFLDGIVRISEAPEERFKSTNLDDRIALDGGLGAAAYEFLRRGLLDLRLGHPFQTIQSMPSNMPPSVATLEVDGSPWFMKSQK